MASSAGSLIPLGARSFGKYELLARLATGGMAEIFLARSRDPSGVDSVLVIKRILPHLAEDARFVAMFRDEARLAAQIEHANVCRVIDMGAVGETYFIALEYLHGMPLSRVLVRAARSGQPLDIRLVAGLMVQCCAGLHHAHELRDENGRFLDVVHRDISPPNIFVNASGVVKLLDFGVAKAHGASEKTRTGTVKGKNAYMSPEQVLGQPMDRRSDLFSLGIVLWEALTAQRLFMREVDFETFRAITEGDVPDVRALRPDMPAELADVVERALSLDPGSRYATALELSDAVAAAVAGIGPPAGEGEISSFLRRRFAYELNARDQLLDATGVGAAADDAASAPPDGTPPIAPAGVPGTPAKRPSADVSAEAATLVRRSPSTSPPASDVEIHWAQSRKSRPMARITTGPIPRGDGTPPATPRASSPRATVAALGSRPLADSAVSESRVVPRTQTMRIRALTSPLRWPGPRYSTDDHGQEAAAFLFLGGLFGLLVLLWWLL